MIFNSNNLDVLCVGTAAYDLTFTVMSLPSADAKLHATALSRCGGGPAANAAVTISRLGHSAAFAGYLGQDPFGDENLKELAENGVRTELIERGPFPTPISAVLIQPDGNRLLVNYRDPSGHLAIDSIDLNQVNPGIVLFDGHEPAASTSIADEARRHRIPIILDAGGVRQTTVELAGRCDHLVCALQFALDYTGAGDQEEALDNLAGLAPTVIITLGENGLIWSKGRARGRLPAFAIDAVDTTGAGDVFHGAYAVALVEEMDWEKTLRFASAAAGLCCLQVGGRPGAPSRQQIETFLAADPPLRDSSYSTGNG